MKFIVAFWMLKQVQMSAVHFVSCMYLIWMFSEWRPKSVTFVIIYTIVFLTAFCILYFNAACFMTNSNIMLMHNLLFEWDVFPKIGKMEMFGEGVGLWLDRVKINTFLFVIWWWCLFSTWAGAEAQQPCHSAVS